MTILWIYNMPLITEAGGTERITSLVAKGLTARGHRCLGILVFDEKDRSMTYGGKPVTDLYKFLKDNHVDVVINQIAYSRWLLESFLNDGGKRWHDEGGKIISCLHFDPKPASTLYFHKNIKDKTLKTYFDIIKSFILYPYFTIKQQRSTGNVYNWIYDNSDWFVTLSECHFDYIRKVTKRKEYERLTAINNPLTFNDIAPESLLDSKKKTILVCSRMDEYQKRISYILRSWKQLLKYEETNDWELKIIGSGPNLNDYKRYVDKNKLTNVSFYGRRTPEQFYEEASIFLMTSCGIEGWGLTITESLQKGVVPVVMNTCAVYSDIIENGCNGFLTKGSDLKDFVRHIRSLISDEQLLYQMQINTLKSAERFTLSKTMEKWDKILL